MQMSPGPASLAGDKQWLVPAQMPTSQILCAGGLCGLLLSYEESGSKKAMCGLERGLHW